MRVQTFKENKHICKQIKKNLQAFKIKKTIITYSMVQTFPSNWNTILNPIWKAFINYKIKLWCFALDELYLYFESNHGTIVWNINKKYLYKKDSKQNTKMSEILNCIFFSDEDEEIKHRITNEINPGFNNKRVGILLNNIINFVLQGVDIFSCKVTLCMWFFVLYMETNPRRYLQFV